MKTTIKMVIAMLLIAFSFFEIACEPSDSDSNLSVLTSPSGQNQTIAANIDDNGVLTFNAQMLMAEGGNPLHNYTWTLVSSSNPPVSLRITPQTGVVTWNGTSTEGLTRGGYTTFEVEVSDGDATKKGNIDIHVTDYSISPWAILQQLSTTFTLMDGVKGEKYAASLFVMGGTPPYSWQLDDTYTGSNDLTMAELTLDNASGIVHGTVNTNFSGSQIKFRATVTDSDGSTSKGIYIINLE
jgi:hypothetical protein